MNILLSILQYSLLKLTKRIGIIEAIELRSDNESQFFFNAVALRAEKNKITIERQLIRGSIDTLGEWYKELQFTQTCPTLLVVNSDKILHKIIDTENNTNLPEFVKEVAPNSNPEDFFTQSFPLTNKKYFFSLVRKNHVNNILGQLNTLNMSFINIFIGPFSIFTTYKHIYRPDPTDTYQIEFQNYSFTICNDSFIDHKILLYTIDNEEINERSIHFGENTLKTSLLIPFSYGVYYLLKPLYTIDISHPSAKHNKDKFIYQSLGRPLLFGSAAILFLLLAISSILFTIYKSKYEQLQLNYSLNKEKWEQLQAKREEHLKKMAILEQSGLDRSSTIAFYADQLTQELPDGIYLRKMDIHPVNTRSLDNNIQFLKDKIIVDGNCFSSDELNDWIYDIKNYKWIKTVIIKDYKRGLDSSLGAFSIEITKE